MTIAVATDKSGFNATTDNVSSANMMTFANSVDTLFNNVLNGVQAADRFLYSAAETLSIATGVITVPSRELVTVSAETGTTDTLDTIGVSNNRRVILFAAAGHTITINGSGTGNITSVDGGSPILTGNAAVMLVCHNSQWAIIGSVGAGTALVNQYNATADPATGDDSGDGYGEGSLWVYPGIRRAWLNVQDTAAQAVWKMISQPRNLFSIRAAGATALGVGIANPTVANSPANANDAVNTFMTLPTTASSGNLGGFVTTSFNLVRPGHDPIVDFTVKTSSEDPPANTRIWIGLVDADITNVDTLAAGREFIGWRYSTVAGDTSWRPVLHDGTTQNVGTGIQFVGASTVYRLRFRVVSSISTVYFSVNDSAETAMTTNFPASTQDLGLVCRIITTTTAIKTLNFARAEVVWG